MVAYETALIAFWKKVRPDENPEIMIPQILTDPMMRAFVQAAFEAGRTWQADHPTASTEFPDYCAPSISEKEAVAAAVAAMTPEQSRQAMQAAIAMLSDDFPDFSDPSQVINRDL